MPKFNVGDKVICINAVFQDVYGLRKGMISTVLEINEDREEVRYMIDGVQGLKKESRFELYVEPKEQEEIRLRVVLPYRPAGLRLGAIVTVAKEHATTYLLKEFPGKLFKKERFELVNAAKADPKGEAITFDKKINRPLVVGDMVDIVGYQTGWGNQNKKTEELLQENKKGATIVEVCGYPWQGDKYVRFSVNNADFYCPIKWLEFASPQEQKKAVVKQPPKKKDLGNILDQIKDASGSSLNDYAWHVVGADEYIKQCNQPCFASFNRTQGPIDQIAVSLVQPYKGTYKLPENKQAMFKRWLSYIYNDSPWSSCFINKKDIDDVIEKGYELDCNKGISQLMGAAITIRDGYEHSIRLIAFDHFLEEGYDGNTAFLLSFMVNYNNGVWNYGAMSQGHSNMDGRHNAEQLFKFFREGYHLKCALEELPANKKQHNYMVAAAIAEGGTYPYAKEEKSIRYWVKEHCPAVKSGQGWDAKESITEANINKLSKLVEATLKGN